MEWGFRGGLDVKESAYHVGFDLGLIWGGNILWRRAWQSIPLFLPGEPHRQRNLVGYSPWCLKEPDTTERLNWTEALSYRYPIFKKESVETNVTSSQWLFLKRMVSVKWFWILLCITRYLPRENIACDYMEKRILASKSCLPNISPLKILRRQEKYHQKYL